ncbi:sigma factor [Kitasatospora paranensis]|uniref:Sigma factor n=1 Tax=Kitasatospora paranensis TaxID=258053 RepID=A0ABW2G4E9_9ACTN
MGKAQARALSDARFVRLAGLEPGTAASSHVRGTLIELNVPLVRFAAARFRSRASTERQGLTQAGTVGLIKAVDGYDIQRGVEFLAYALPTIIGEIKRYFRDTIRPVRVPRSLQELYLTVTHAADRLEQRSGRLPTAAELATDLDVDQPQAERGLMVGRAYRAYSLDELRGDSSDGIATRAERIGGCDPELDLVGRVGAGQERTLAAPLAPSRATPHSAPPWAACSGPRPGAPPVGRSAAVRCRT